MTVGNLALLTYFPHRDDPQIPSSSFSTANSTIATSTLVSNPTSTIDSTLMKTVVNCSIISSVRPWFQQQSHNPHSYMSLDSDGPVKLELPEQWLWDIIDEFIYQYQVFCSWRSKVKNKTEDELVMLGEGGPVCLVLSFSSVPALRLNDFRSGVPTASSMFSIPWCKNPRSTSTSSPREREKHWKKSRALVSRTYIGS